LAALVRFIGERDRAVIVVDCAVRNGSPARALLGSLWHFLRSLPKAGVVTLHLSDRGALSAGVLFWLFARIMRKPIIFRPFGGSFFESFLRLPPWRRRLTTRTILASDAVLLQTRAQLEALGVHCRVARWFPTARSAPTAKWRFAVRRAPRALRCLFLGHIRRAKGILDAIEAISSFPSVTLDVYGPLIDVTLDDLGAERVTYHGELESAAVSATMAEYDMLLFPTFYAGEGYSGVIVEAAQVGLPILLSRWQALPEMFPEDAVFFVNPGQVDEIAAVIRTVLSEPELLRERSERAKAHANRYAATKVYGDFLDLCDSLSQTHSSKSRVE
jgi:glycosyltransferase involved in cell wall biosynthesis